MRSGPVIYGLTCICHGRIRYVGQTMHDRDERLKVHLWHARTPTSKAHKSHLSNWIRKHGEENVFSVTLEECRVTELDARERAWIAEFRKSEAGLVNILEGGSQPRGHERPEHSARMSGTGNPMYGVDRAKEMAHARSFQGRPSEATKRRWSEQRKGEGNGRAVLTEDDVRAIRAEPQKYGVLSRLARQYGVTTSNILDIRKRRTWKHVE